MSVIKIKRSGAAGSPSSLGQGEMAYSYLSGSQANGGDRLYIGTGTEIGGNAANIEVIGGKYFTEKLDHTPGTLTANSALITDDDSKLNQLLVDNIDINGNTIRSTNTDGDLLLSANGSGVINVDSSRITNVSTPSANTDAATKKYVDDYFVGGFLTLFNISGDTGSNDGIKYQEILSFTGGTGVTTTISNNQIAFDIGQDVSTTADVTFANAAITGDLSVSGDLTVNGNTTFINTTSLEVEDSIIVLAGNNTADTLDIGYIGSYNDGTSRYTGMIRNSDDGDFYIFDGYTQSISNNQIDVNHASFNLVNLHLNSIIVSGTVDGRDIAADGLKLDTIEANADVTDATNVQAAGALMDSELSDVTAIKAINQGLSTSDSPTFANTTINGGELRINGSTSGQNIISSRYPTGGIAINSSRGSGNTTYVDFDAPDLGGVGGSIKYRFGLETEQGSGKTSEIVMYPHDGTTSAVIRLSSNGDITLTGTVDGRDVSVDGAKLDGIEANADVTDATNVQAAGALMDSELTDITSIKAIDQGLSTTDSPTFNDIIVTGNVDGRDVASDGAKLDGIESGATADQTGAEIKALYEAEADTNAFTDSDKTKLDGIESGADVTDATNVQAAGALMDSELTDVVSVKAIDQGLSTTDSPTFNDITVSDGGELRLDGSTSGQSVISSKYPTGGIAINSSRGTGNPTYIDFDAPDLGGVGGSILYRFGFETEQGSGETSEIVMYPHDGTTSAVIRLSSNGDISLTGTVDGRDVASDGTKLDGIESGADVTDATNVQAAGALMDSELTDITSIKAIDQGLSTTDSPSFSNITVSDGGELRLDGSTSGQSIISARYLTGGIAINSSRGTGNPTYIDFDAPDLGGVGGSIKYRFGFDTEQGSGETSEIIIYPHDGTTSPAVRISSNGAITATNIIADIDGGSY